MAEKQIHYLRQLRDRVAKSFDEEELRALVFDLGLDWDELQGTRKTARVQDLIVQLGRNGRLSELVELVRERRPCINWPDVPPTEQQTKDAVNAGSITETAIIRLPDNEPIYDCEVDYYARFEDVLRNTNTALADTGLKHEFKEKTALEAKIQFFLDEMPLGQIEITRMRKGTRWCLRFDTVEKWRRVYEAGLKDNLLYALEWPELSVFRSALLGAGKRGQKHLYYDPRLNGYQEVLLTLPEVGKAIKRVLARNPWRVDTQNIEEETIYRIKVPGDETRHVRVVFSPDVQKDRYQFSVELEEEFDDFISRFPPISAAVRFTRKVEREICKELRKANAAVKHEVISARFEPDRNVTATEQKEVQELPDRVTASNVIERFLREKYRRPSGRVPQEWTVTFKVADGEKFLAWLKSRNRIAIAASPPLRLANRWLRDNPLMNSEESFPVRLEKLIRPIETYDHIQRFGWYIVEDTGDIRHSPAVAIGIYFDVDTLYTEGAQVEAGCLDDPVISRFFHNQLKDAAKRFPEIQKQLQAQDAMLDEPAAVTEQPTGGTDEEKVAIPRRPEKQEPIDKWFDYYHQCKQSRIKYTLKDLAADVNLTHGYVRQKHSEYLAENQGERTEN